MDVPQTNQMEAGLQMLPSKDQSGRTGTVTRRPVRAVRTAQSHHAGRGDPALDKPAPSADIVLSGMKETIDLDIDALLGCVPIPDTGMETGLAGLLDRQIAREIAQQTRITTLLLIGHLSGPRCLPTRCEEMCPNFKLISMRKIGGSQIAMFSVPVEREMAELFEEIDGRRGIHAIAYDSNGRPKESYIL